MKKLTKLDILIIITALTSIVLSVISLVSKEPDIIYLGLNSRDISSFLLSLMFILVGIRVWKQNKWVAIFSFAVAIISGISLFWL